MFRWYLAGSMNFSITYKGGSFKLTTSTDDANWGGNPDNGKSTSSYIVILAKGPISFKLGLQSLTAQSIMEAELVSAAAMKESLFCRNMMMELGFTEGFRSVPVYIDNTSALHVAANRTFSPRAKHICPQILFRSRASEGRKGHHPFCQDEATTRRFGNESSQKASSSLPHQAHQRFQSLRGHFTCVSYSSNAVSL